MQRPTPLQLLMALGVALAIGFATLLLIVPRLTGTVPLNVLSGSMTPAIPVGSMVFVDQTPPDEIQVDDIITYDSPSTENRSLTSHRVVEIQESENGSPQFITRGDANEGRDRLPVTVDAYRGRVAFVVPFVGTFRNFVSSVPGLLLLGLIGLAVGLGDRVRLKRADTAEIKDPSAGTPSELETPGEEGPTAPAVSTIPGSLDTSLDVAALRRHKVSSDGHLSIERKLLLVRVAVAPTRRAALLSVTDLIGARVEALSSQELVLSLCVGASDGDDILRFLESSHYVIEARETAPLLLGEFRQPHAGDETQEADESERATADGGDSSPGPAEPGSW